MPRASYVGSQLHMSFGTCSLRNRNPTLRSFFKFRENFGGPSVRLPADTTVGGWNPHDNTRAALVARVRASVAPRAIRLSLIN